MDVYEDGGGGRWFVGGDVRLRRVDPNWEDENCQRDIWI